MISRFLPQVVRRFFSSAPRVEAPSEPRVEAEPEIIEAGYTLIEHRAQLALLLEALDQVDEVAIDTEADNMYHYHTRVCLVQLLVGPRIFLVDVLAKLDCAPLWARLQQKHLVMHGSDFDLRLLRDLCQFQTRSLFDTMLAAQLLNRSRVGLAALLEEHFGVQLDKDQQKANWSRRPLTDKLLDYAATDVLHLPALRDLLTAELRRLGRYEWLEQQCQRQIAVAQVGFPRDDDNAWRIGRSERLRGRGQCVLHAVWHWRESQAERIDVPPFKVCSNDHLLRFAEAADQEGDLAAVLAASHLGKRHDRLLPTLTEAIKAGLARAPDTLPRRRARGDQAPLNADELARQDRIKAQRDRRATELSLDPTLIANRSQLAQLARTPERLDEILLPWQAGLLREEPAFQSGAD